MKYILYKTFVNMKVSQYFGETPFAKAHPEIYSPMLGHEGIDYDYVPAGTAIHAPHGGIVVRDIDKPTRVYGNHICIWDRRQEIATYYCHLQENCVKVGDLIKVNQIIGYVGDTGTATGAHLHFGLLETKNGRRINEDNGYYGFINPLEKSKILWLEF